MDDNQKKYEEAAKEFFPAGSDASGYKREGFLAGASFAENELKNLIDYDGKAYPNAVKTSKDFRDPDCFLIGVGYGSMAKSLQQEDVKKEAHNAAIDKVLETLNIRVEFGHLEAEWKRIKEELEKMKI